MEKRRQPVWNLPENHHVEKLKLYNSLTRQKEIFEPQNGNRVLWYSCGPTVYDASHMGHARSYISFDILRRVLSKYFSYDVFYVMNITDIDDKIIKRARQNHLYEEYIKDKSSNSLQVIDDVKKAISEYESNLQDVKDADKINMMQKSLQNASNALKIAESENNLNEESLQNLLHNSQDILSDYLDAYYGKNVTDNSIFSSLPAKWEEAFYADMEALNVLPPDVVTRVSEYVPEIVTYVEKIIENGWGYESNGSVYFDTIKFNNTTGHFYAKLVPEAFGDLKQLHEGEGDLSISEERLNEKKNVSDFAIWKSSKPGEPSWDSPWGKGRPGWHIECSVMASAILGSSLDIHTGGFDLKFPHHDNELAQAEAYFNNDHWVRYFLHSGHLTISGCKMSKSLKNFVTISKALEQNSARQLRFAFLLHSWKDTLDYSSKTLDMAIHYERTVMEFFLNVKDAIRHIPSSGRDSFQKWDLEEHTLNSMFEECQTGVHHALCDNIDTRSALDRIREFISTCNVYLAKKKADNSKCNRSLLTNIMSYINRILEVFGVVVDDTFGFQSTSNVENLVMPYLSTLATFRENVRMQAKEIKAFSILKLCDELRDDILPDLGVRLEDQEGRAAAIKLVNREELAREKQMKQKMELEKKLEKEKMKQLQEKQEAQKRIPPAELFKEGYSKFNEKGIPTHDASGKELSNKQVKKLEKQYQVQEKKYNEYLKQQATTNGVTQ